MFAFSLGAILPLLGGSFIQDAMHRLIAVVILTSFGLAAFGLFGSVLGGTK